MQLAPLQVASLFACVAICVIRDRQIAFILKSGRRAESSYASGLQLSDIRTLELVNTRHAADKSYVKCGSAYGGLRTLPYGIMLMSTCLGFHLWVVQWCA